MVSAFYTIKNELNKYGISSSGNIQSDIAAINKKKQENGESTIDASSFMSALTQMNQQQNNTTSNIGQFMGGPSPVMSILSSLGLSPSGTLQGDITSIESKISELESSGNLSTEQKANLESMKAELEAVKQREEQKAQNSNSTQNTQNTQQAQQNQGGGGTPPWASLMQSLGLSMQGSKEADFSAISQRLSMMRSGSTLSAAQKSNLDLLESQFQQYQNQY
ncbi:MAG: hypothetical protein PHE78_06250 [Candidatus Gastranaerophilales bacterium]|nr:hypothetical protein [Candidatus Gastranaerophilales bacterium]